MERSSEKSQTDKKEGTQDELAAKVEKGIYKSFSASDPRQTAPIDPLSIKIDPKFKDPISTISQSISDTISDTLTNVNDSVEKGTKRIWEMASSVFTEDKKP